jgi:hypothetical protein
MERVNHPTHYGGENNIYEAIKVIEAWDLDFYTGNAAKYICRAGKKGQDKEIEDLEKALWYLQKKIAKLKAAAVNNHFMEKTCFRSEAERIKFKNKVDSDGGC